MPSHIVEALERKGHDIHVATSRHTFGRGQIILKMNKPAYYTAAQKREQTERSLLIRSQKRAREMRQLDIFIAFFAQVCSATEEDLQLFHS